VPADRLLKDNEVNRLKQKELAKEHPASAAGTRTQPKATTSAAKEVIAGTSASASTRSGTRKETGTRGTKRGRDDVRAAIECFASAYTQASVHSRMGPGGQR
jgi:hypothetical protein